MARSWRKPGDAQAVGDEGPLAAPPQTTIFGVPLSKTVSRRGEPMRNTLLRLAGLTLCALPLSAQSADDIIAKYIKTVGGMDRIQAVTTLRRTGKFTGSGGVPVAGLPRDEQRHTGV